MSIVALMALTSSLAAVRGEVPSACLAILALTFGVAAIILARWSAAPKLFRSLATTMLAPVVEHRLAIAEIHAAIVAILFGASWIYAINFVSNAEQLEERAFDEARRMREVRFSTTFRLGGDRTYVTESHADREKLAVELSLAAKGMSIRYMRLSLAERGREALRMMGELSRAQPFRADIPSDLSTLRQWATDSQALARSLLLTWQSDSRALQEVLNAFFLARRAEAEQLVQQMQQAMEPLRKSASESARAALDRAYQQEVEVLGFEDLRNFHVEFFRNSEEVAQIARDVLGRLRDLDTFKARRFSHLWLTVPLIIAAVAFTAGVILPLLWTNVPVLLALWLPIGCYVLLFAWIFCRVTSV
jgi:hypothetical protein